MGVHRDGYIMGVHRDGYIMGDTHILLRQICCIIEQYIVANILNREENTEE